VIIIIINNQQHDHYEDLILILNKINIYNTSCVLTCELNLEFLYKHLLGKKYMYGTEVIATEMCKIFNFYNFQMVVEDKKFLSGMAASFPWYFNLVS
jgi:hypothetical protein